MRISEELINGYKQLGSSSEAPAVSLVYRGYTPLTRSTISSSGSNGLNIVAAILVTASSMMVLLALRLWLCRCSSSMFWRRSGSSDPDGSSAAPELVKISKNGVAREVINKFALVDFKALSSSKYEKTCTVCLCEFNSKDMKIRLLPGCNHSFHPACIEMWLYSHNSCPICRKSLIMPPVPAPAQVPSSNLGEGEPSAAPV